MLDLTVLDLAISLSWWKSKTGRWDVCLISCWKVSGNSRYQWCQLKITHIFQKNPMHVLSTNVISAEVLPIHCVQLTLMHLWSCCLVGCKFLVFLIVFDFGSRAGSACFVWGGLGGYFEGWLLVFVRWRIIFLLLCNWWEGKFFFYSLSASCSLHLPNLFLMLICLFIYSFLILYEHSSILCMLYPSIFKSSCITSQQLYKQVSI